MKKIQFAPGAELGKEIEERINAESASLVARRMAARYVELVRGSIPYLTVQEWRLLANSTFCQSDMVRRDIGSQWPRAAAYEVVTTGLAEQHGIDGEAFVAKLEGLSHAQVWAALDVLERYFAKLNSGRPDLAALPGEARLA